MSITPRKILKLILILFSSLVGVLILLAVIVWSGWVYSVNTISRADLRVESCNELPQFTQIDKWFVTNKENLSVFLDDLSECNNNVFVCERYSKCKQEKYVKHKISSGNTVIEWKKVLGCGSEKGAILLSHTSACEIQKISEFEKKYPEFASFPKESYNY